MIENLQFLSPRKVAQAIGVSESSLKRWCDKGAIAYSRTAGGHRRISRASVVSFLRTTGQSLVQPELLGLPHSINVHVDDLTGLVDLCTHALLTGDEPRFRELIIGPYIQGHPLGRLFDVVMAGSLTQIGRLWATGQVEVYQERMSVEFCLNILREIKLFLPPTDKGHLLAIGGTFVGDPYQIPNLMVELMFQNLGWQTISLGCGLPLETMQIAAKKYQPNMFWISGSQVDNRELFVHNLKRLIGSTPLQTGMVVGGQEVNDSIRNACPEAVFCDDMQQLQAFLRNLTIVASQTTPWSDQTGKRNCK